ncbi:MAG: hypothetical protein Q9168_007825 [Polycauliona sp. 1 TL-2023]
MVLPITAHRRLSICDGHEINGRPISQRHAWRIWNMNLENLNHSDFERCRDNPEQAGQIYTERVERLTKKVRDREKRIEQATDSNNEFWRKREVNDMILGIAAEQIFIKKLKDIGFDAVQAVKDIRAAKIKNDEESRRKTRYEGKVTPFTGERLEGEHLTRTPRKQKKRKAEEAYPSPPSSRPAKKVRKATPSLPPTPAKAGPSKRTGLPSPSPSPSPEAGRRPQKVTLLLRIPGTDLVESWSKGEHEVFRPDILPIEQNNDPVVWNEDFDLNQPEGTGPGLIDAQEPDPICSVKRINCRIKIPGTDTWEYWRAGKVVIGDLKWQPWESAEKRADYDPMIYGVKAEDYLSGRRTLAAAKAGKGKGKEE